MLERKHKARSICHSPVGPGDEKIPFGCAHRCDHLLLLSLRSSRRYPNCCSERLSKRSEMDSPSPSNGIICPPADRLWQIDLALLFSLQH